MWLEDGNSNPRSKFHKFINSLTIISSTLFLVYHSIFKQLHKEEYPFIYFLVFSTILLTFLEPTLAYYTRFYAAYGVLLSSDSNLHGHLATRSERASKVIRGVGL
jgi:hypothetical protein